MSWRNCSGLVRLICPDCRQTRLGTDYEISQCNCGGWLVKMSNWVRDRMKRHETIAEAHRYSS